MKHFKKLFILLALGFLLTACTGTPAPTAPLFVIAGIDANKLLVFQDRALDGIDDDEPRFIKFTEATLAARPIAFDSVEENSSRSELVVLSRSQTRDADTRVIPTYLDFFNTRGLDPNDSGTFRRNRAIDLREFTYPFPLADLCPIDLEVTSDGSHAVIFNSPLVCDERKLDTDNVIVIIPLKTTPTGVVPSLTLENSTKPLVTSSILTNTPIPTGMYLDQSGNTLYYLRRIGGTLVELRSLSFGAYTSNTPESSSNPATVLSSLVGVGVDQFRDITKVGSNIAVLSDRDYVSLSQSTPITIAPPEIDTVDVRSQGARAFVQDFTSTRLLILDSNERLIYHADPSNTASTQTDIDGTVSTWNTRNDFLYIAGSDAQGQGFFNIIDTLPLSQGDTNLGPLRAEETCQESSAICEMVRPTALSWVEGILLPEDQ
jgi:hypothetical protein